MFYVMASVQQSYNLSERLIRVISNWQNVVGENEDVETVLEEGADVNRLHGTLLPLHVACMVADTYCARLLLEKGAQINAEDGYGRAALHYAAEKDVVCVELLLAWEADVNIRDANQDTALHWAAYKNNARCVKALLQHGADANASDYNHDTPLSWAAMKGNLESIKVLLEYNAKVNTVNLRGYTPLMRTSVLQASGLNTDKDDACLELLIKANGQFDFRKENGLLPEPLNNDNKLSDMLMSYCSSSRSLQDLCRYAVRHIFGPRYLVNVVPKLPIPQRLQEMVLLQR